MLSCAVRLQPFFGVSFSRHLMKLAVLPAKGCVGWTGSPALPSFPGVPHACQAPPFIDYRGSKNPASLPLWSLRLLRP